MKSVFTHRNLLIVVLLAIIVGQQVTLLMTSLRIEFAREQVEMFDDQRKIFRGKRGPVVDDRIQFVKEYYPSGTKQVAGSKLDTIVERFRQAVIEELEEGQRGE